MSLVPLQVIIKIKERLIRKTANTMAVCRDHTYEKCWNKLFQYSLFFLCAISFLLGSFIHHLLSLFLFYPYFSFIPLILIPFSLIYPFITFLPSLFCSLSLSLSLSYIIFFPFISYFISFSPDSFFFISLHLFLTLTLISFVSLSLSLSSHIRLLGK